MKKFLFFFLILSFQALAQWNVVPETSQLQFLSTKQNHITEVHSVQTFSGVLAENGEFSLQVDLASIDTGIEIRDKRMREILFDLSAHRFVNLKGVLDKKIKDLRNFETVNFNADLELNGTSQKVDGKITVIKTPEGALAFSLSSPLIVMASKFELTAGIEKLREIAGLKSIGYAVPVTGTFYLAPIK